MKKLADYREGRGQSKAYILMRYLYFQRLEKAAEDPGAHF